MKSIPNDRARQSDVGPLNAPRVPHEPSIEALRGGFGAELKGVDLRRPVADSVSHRIRTAFVAHHLLVFRRQQLTRAQMADCARMFGEPDEDAGDRPDTAAAVAGPITHRRSHDAQDDQFSRSHYFWQSEKSWLAAPPLLAMLYAPELPPAGGDTQFADMTRAYLALTGDQKQRIASLRAVHSLEAMRISANEPPLSEAARNAAPPAPHPLVRTHPDTGEKSLYVGMHCSGIVGMNEGEARLLLQELLLHATLPRFTSSHSWAGGDLVLWDSRCLLHRTIANYRLGAHLGGAVWRLTVKGSVPV